MADAAEGRRSRPKALAIGRSIGAADIVAWALLGLASALWVEGRWDEAIAGATETMTLSRAMGLHQQELTAMNVLALAQRFRGDVDGAIATGQQALALSRAARGDSGSADTPCISWLRRRCAQVARTRPSGWRAKGSRSDATSTTSMVSGRSPRCSPTSSSPGVTTSARRRCSAGPTRSGNPSRSDTPSRTSATTTRSRADARRSTGRGALRPSV